MQQPALSEKAGQILLRLYAQAGDLQDVGALSINHADQAILTAERSRQNSQGRESMQSFLIWQRPVRLAPGKAIGAMGEDSVDVSEEAQRELAAPVLNDEFCKQGSLSTLQPPAYGTISGNPVYNIPANAPVKKGPGQSTTNIESLAIPDVQKAPEGQIALPEAKGPQIDRAIDKPGLTASSLVKSRRPSKDDLQSAMANNVHELPGPPSSRQDKQEAAADTCLESKRAPAEMPWDQKLSRDLALSKIQDLLQLKPPAPDDGVKMRAAAKIEASMVQQAACIASPVPEVRRPSKVMQPLKMRSGPSAGQEPLQQQAGSQDPSVAATPTQSPPEGRTLHPRPAPIPRSNGRGRICGYYNSKQGCRNGERCRFEHVRQDFSHWEPNSPSHRPTSPDDPATGRLRPDARPDPKSGAQADRSEHATGRQFSRWNRLEQQVHPSRALQPSRDDPSRAAHSFREEVLLPESRNHTSTHRPEVIEPPMRGLHPVRDEAMPGRADGVPEGSSARDRDHAVEGHKIRHASSPFRARGSRSGSKHKKRSKESRSRPSDGEANGDDSLEGCTKDAQPGSHEDRHARKRNSQDQNGQGHSKRHRASSRSRHDSAEKPADRGRHREHRSSHSRHARSDQQSYSQEEHVAAQTSAGGLQMASAPPANAI
ncbi:hypothetical protein WJX74_009191 [Apatococcus lobatus]|uniref:C3H1-type domain-containing protein n=1 Tax=Apatococcus lobatus TaxID=904363 RepID=A0AAW1RM63_9CHLO